MGLKAALVQAATATGTPTYTQDFTDDTAGFSSDVKAAIIFSSDCTTNHTSRGGELMTLGIAAGANSVVMARAHNDGVAIGTTAQGGRYEQGWVYSDVAGGGASDGEASVNSFLSNGIRLDWLDQPTAQQLTTVILLGGDIEASVAHSVFTAGTSGESISVTHGLSATPELIVAITNFSTTSTGNAGQSPSIGFWDGTDVQHLSRLSGNNGTNHRVVANLVSGAIGGRIQNSGAAAIVNSLTISAVGASTFTLTQTGTVPGLNYVSYLCLRGTTTPITAKTGTYTLPTGTGNADMGLSMGAAPQVLMMIPWRATTTGAADGDPAEAWGLNAAVNNGSTQYGGVSTVIQNNVATSFAKSQSTNSQALRILDDTGAADVEATVNAWNSGDVQLSFSNVSSAFVIPYLAFGAATTSAPTVTAVPDLYGNNVATVTGTDFGASRGNGQVYICPTDDVDDANRVAQTILSWTDTSIVMTVARGNLYYNTSLYLFVVEDGGTSNAAGYVVQIKSGITLTWTA